MSKQSPAPGGLSLPYASVICLHCKHDCLIHHHLSPRLSKCHIIDFLNFNRLPYFWSILQRVNSMNIWNIITFLPYTKDSRTFHKGTKAKKKYMCTHSIYTLFTLLGLASFPSCSHPFVFWSHEFYFKHLTAHCSNLSLYLLEPNCLFLATKLVKDIIFQLLYFEYVITAIKFLPQNRYGWLLF